MLDGIKKQMAQTQPNQIKEPVKTKGRAKRYFKLLLLLAIVATAFYVMYQLNKFFETNKLVFRTPVQSPVLIVKREIPQVENVEIVVAKELTDKDKILSKENGNILWRIYGIESNFGQLDNCKKSGLVNGFGFKQNAKQWVCYKSLDEVADQVDQWVNDHKNIPLPNMLCFYNLGQNIRNCEYYQKYLAVKIN